MNERERGGGGLGPQSPSPGSAPDTYVCATTDLTVFYNLVVGETAWSKIIGLACSSPFLDRFS